MFSPDLDNRRPRDPHRDFLHVPGLPQRAHQGHEPGVDGALLPRDDDPEPADAADDAGAHRRDLPPLAEATLPHAARPQHGRLVAGAAAPRPAVQRDAVPVGRLRSLQGLGVQVCTVSGTGLLLAYVWPKCLY